MTSLALTTVLTSAVTGAAVGPAHATSDPKQEVRISYARTINGELSIGSMTAHSQREAIRLIAAKRQERGVIAAQVDNRVSSLGLDPLLPQQYGLRVLGGPQTWAYPDARSTVVAVIDSGVDGTHPDLAGRVMQGAEFLSGGSTVSTGNGWRAPHFHGTAVAGIIGAAVNNSTGMAGMARGVRILPVRVLDANGGGYGSDVATGIVWAVDHGAKVINLSLGGAQADAVQKAAIDYALSKDVVVVAAAGNQGDAGNPVVYPAAFPGVLGVGAYDATGRVASFSERGSFVDLAAPGVGITATGPGGRYLAGSGTSFAAPFVAATAALVRGNSPTLSGTAVADLLTRTARDMGPVGRDSSYGAGSVNPVRALSAVARPTAARAQLIAPRAAIAGARVRMSAAVAWRPSGTRALLQTYRNGTWSTVSSTATSWLGQASFTVALPTRGTAARYRTVAAGVGSPVRTIALRPVPRRTVRVSAPARVTTNQVAVSTTVAGGRTVNAVPVSLDYRSPGSTTWRRLGTWRTSATGTLRINVALASRGTWAFRAVAQTATSGSVTVSR